MTLTRVLSTSSLLALLAGPALADLTAEEVLADQLAQMSLYGLSVETVGESKSGDVLTVQSLTATADIPQEDVTINMTMGGAIFTEQGDGSVLVTYPASIPLSVEVTGGELADTVTVSMTINQTGLSNLATGNAEQLRYEFTGESASISDLKFTAPDEAGEVDMDIAVDMTGLLGIMNIGAGAIRPYDLDMTIGAMKMLVSVTDPNGEGNFDLTFDVSDVAAAYAGSLAQQNLMDSFAQTIANGNSTRGTFTHGAASYDFKVDSPEGGVEGQASVASGNFNFAMDANGIDYGGTSTDMNLTVGGSAIPLPPMSFQMAETGGRFQLPVVPGEDPQDFAFAMSMKGLEVDPFLWSMIDPGEQLPRDPATLIIDTDGQIILTQDIFDPEFSEQPMMGPPGQINALNVNDLQLSLAGAELTGDGALTFINDNMIPMPVGVVNLMLTGGNGLLDTLVGMGLVPEDQAMGARMMTGMFARPGEGEDSLVSTIEMNEDGSILANGQRIR